MSRRRGDDDGGAAGGGAGKRARRFSLRGTCFHFHGIPQSTREDLLAALQSCGGELYSERRDHTDRPSASGGSNGGETSATDRCVYVLTGYWVDWYLEHSVDSLGGRPFLSVTVFWLQEMLRLQRWIPPHASVFFRPPPKPDNLSDVHFLQYPMDYQDMLDGGDGKQQVTDGCDGDGDVTMEAVDTAAAAVLPPRRYRMQLPCSPQFTWSGKVPLWPYFAAHLTRPMRNMQELSATLKFLSLTDPRRSLNCLEMALSEMLTRDEQTTFFRDLLPEMTRLVLALPQMFPTPPLLLTPIEDVVGSSSNGKARVESQRCRLTKLQALALMCGCFFGVFPNQDTIKRPPSQTDGPSAKQKTRHGSARDDDMLNFPFFSVERMFYAPPHMEKLVGLKAHKLRCLLQYFLRVVPRAIAEPAILSLEVIDFTRVGVHVPPECDFKSGRMEAEEVIEALGTATPQCEESEGGAASKTLRLARCVSNCLIEELDGHLQIDFANRFPGGGVMNSGCVQEEIRFMLSPELLIACLVFAKLEPHEAFVVHGSERYSNYCGYAGSFVFAGNFEDSTRSESLAGPLDTTLQRRQSVVVGIDATDYGSARVERQYTREHVFRDLLKAYAGFSYSESDRGSLGWSVATGNWGCGVFQGDRELKFLIQWLAASLCGREMVYVLFESDVDLQNKVDPLLALAATSTAHDWDRQTGRLMRWLAQFLFNELNNRGRGVRGQTVLSRAFLSLEKALADHSKQLPEQEQQAEQSEVAPTEEKGSKRMEEEQPGKQASTTEQRAKKPKEFQQKTMQDFFASK